MTWRDWQAITPFRSAPPVDEPVLVVANGNAHVAVWRFIDTDNPYMRWEEPCGCPIDDEPTHWMPLPALPLEPR